jgi:acyl-CoA synthetase (AMP-forming)/AMP-acid ligase II
MAFFADELARFGDDTALITEAGERISYAALAERADAFGEQLRGLSGLPRGLLVLEMRNVPEAIVAYLGALRARWPVILAATGTAGGHSDIVQQFRPDLVCRFDDAHGVVAGPAAASGAALHDDLAVMLSTSGSTGSAKLVKLSRANLHENASSIAEYLAITPDRVAITDLPGHYSYGLSVINSFLASGAALALTDASVVDDHFWALFDAARVTDLAGVPYTYELLERLGFRDQAPPSLRVMTQAGGRLPSALVENYTDFAREAGIDFFVMYGQTEATARMAYLPPEMARDNPACIGVPIPRGSFFLVDDDAREIVDPLVSGELHYRGPNVMMGYALAPEDLASGPALESLATGDIAMRQENGLYRIVGRTSRFSKIAGYRIGYDDVEAILRSAGAAGFVTGDDRTLVVALDAGDAARARDLIVTACGLPLASVFVWRPTEIPRLATGKTDYQGIKRDGLALAAAAADAVLPVSDIARFYARVLNRVEPDHDASFLDLGGDSLTFISASIGLEEILGTLPENWQSLSIRSLQILADGTGPRYGLPGRAMLGTDVLLRLLAILLVFVGHGAPDQTELLRGGSGILFLLAGHSMAIGQVPQLLAGKVARSLKGMAVRLVLPYYLAITGPIVALHIIKPLSWYLFVSLFIVPPDRREILFSYWFFETLVVCTVLVSALFLLSPVRRAITARPFAASATAAVLAGLFCAFGATHWDTGNTVNLTFDAWLYMFLVGFAAAFARTASQKAVVVTIAAVAAFHQFGFTISRPYWLCFALLIVLTIPAIPINRRLRRVLAYLAGATYFMYLSHPVVVDLVRFRLAPDLGAVPHVLLVVLGSALCGTIGLELWNRVMLLLQRYRRMTYREPTASTGGRG